jgi:hypothetical protein
MRTVLAHPRNLCEKATLVALVAPDGLAEVMKPLDSGKDEDPDGDNTTTSGRLIADKSLGALISLGFISASGSEVSTTDLTVRCWQSPQEVTAASFSRVLRSQIWRQAMADDTATTEKRVNDLVHALAVLYAAPEPLQPFEFETGSGRRFADAQKPRFGPQKSGWPVTNKEQWLTFRRWAPYLGLAQSVTAQSLVADASRALVDDLAELPPQRYRVDEFIATCKAHLPICDGGALSLWEPDDDQELSPGMSMSLCQLEADGHLTLPSTESDTGARTVALGTSGESRRVSHITWHPRTPAKGRTR